MTHRALVITCSDTASTSPGADRSGPLLKELVATSGYTDVELAVVPDTADLIGRVITRAVATGVRLVVCTGGTGLGPRDVTPQAIESAGGREVPGIGEAIRSASREQVPATDLSRAGAWTLHDAFVLALPGSPGGVRDGWTTVAPLVSHALDMLSGGGHGAPGPRGEGGPDEHPERADEQSAGAPAVPWVSTAVIVPTALMSLVTRPGAGALVTFEGRVRDHDQDRLVTALTYEGHPGADQVLRTVVAEVLGLTGVLGAIARHRVGELAIGDLAFFVAVSAEHRTEAFEACSWLVDAAKERLPIWKNQVFADGTNEWVNCP